MSRRVRRVFEPKADCVAAARTFAQGTARRWGFDNLQDEVQLVTSELATNAVVHAGTPFAVCLRQATKGLVVEVSDADPTVPTGLLWKPRADVSGRGLGLVAASASAWGVRRTPEGKAVWAQLHPMSPPTAPKKTSLRKRSPSATRPPSAMTSENTSQERP